MQHNIIDRNAMTLDSSTLMETTSHGDVDYPVGVYRVDFSKIHMNFVRWHWHEETEFALVTEGTGIFYIGDKTFTLSAGQAILINRAILHSVRMADGCDNLVVLSIVFSPSIIVGNNNYRLREKFLRPILESKIECLVLAESTTFNQEMINLFLEVFTINRNQTPLYELYTIEFLTQIWIELLSHHAENMELILSDEDTRPSIDQSRSKAAISFIEQHYSENITLDDIADSIHVSKSECCRCIKRTMGVTPFEYLMRYRIYIASAKLCNDNGSPSISDLAASVGFNSSSYFNKLFKKYMNCTPSQYRKEKMQK